MSNQPKYTVYTFGDSPVESQGLSKIETVKAIYRHDRNRFWLEPKMIRIEDGEGNSLGEEHDSVGDDLIYDVWFSDRFGKTKSIYCAYGKTESEAEDKYLLECWDKNRWDANKFLVETEPVCG